MVFLGKGKKYLRGQSQELTGGQNQKPENNELQKRTEESNLGQTGGSMSRMAFLAVDLLGPQDSYSSHFD